MRRPVRAAATLLGLVLTTAACAGGSGGTSGSGGKGKGVVFRLAIVEPVAIDPYNSQESEVENITRFDGQAVTTALFEGLVKVDPRTSELVPGVAERWDHDPPCRQWTFHLRAGSRFSTGEVVTARSFVDGMTRAAVADAASDAAHFLDGIEGYAAVHGTADGQPPTATTFSGLAAPDDRTLVVNLGAPDCEFDKLTVQPVFSPVPPEAGRADPTSAYFAMPVGNGPFKMREPWTRGGRIVLVRNDRYHGTKAHLDEVDFTIVGADHATEAEYGAFRSSTVDWARIPPPELATARSTYLPRKEFLAEPTFGVSYLLVNVANPPLNNVKARQAISLAIDRDAVIDSVFKGFQTKATSLVPPALSRYHQAGVCRECATSDPAKARQLAKEGGIPPGTPVRFSFNTGGGHEEWVAAVAQQLRDVLGLAMDVQGMPFKELVAREEAPDATGLYRASWGADSPSADRFLQPLLSTGALPPGDNRGRYVNPEFDSLLDRAQKARGRDEKVKLTKKAEELAIGEDLALIPMWYRTQYRVFSNRFTDVSLDVFENPILADIRRS